MKSTLWIPSKILSKVKKNCGFNSQWLILLKRLNKIKFDWHKENK